MSTPTLEERLTEALRTRADNIPIDRPPPLGSLLNRSDRAGSGRNHRPSEFAIAAGLLAFVLLSGGLLVATRAARDTDRPTTTSLLPAPIDVPRVGLDLPGAEVRQVVNLVDPWDPSAFPPPTPTSTSSPRAIYRQTGGDLAAPWFVLAPVSTGPAGTIGLPISPPPDAEDLGDGAKLWFVDPVGGIRKAAWRRGDQMLLIKTAQLDTDEIRRVARSIQWPDGDLPVADATGYSFVTSNTNTGGTARYGTITYTVDGTTVEISTGPSTDELNTADTSEMVTGSAPPYDTRPRLGQGGVLIVGAPNEGCPQGCAQGRWYDPKTRTATVLSAFGGAEVAAKVADHLFPLDASTWRALARDHRPDPTQAWSCLPEPGMCRADAAAYRSAARQGSLAVEPTGHVVPGPPPWLSGELDEQPPPPVTRRSGAEPESDPTTNPSSSPPTAPATTTCSPPDTKPAAVSPSDMADADAARQRATEEQARTGWARIKAPDFRSGEWICGWNEGVPASVDFSPKGDVREKLLDAPHGELRGYVYPAVGFVDVTAAADPGFDATTERIRVNGCDPLADRSCHPIR